MTQYIIILLIVGVVHIPIIGMFFSAIFGLVLLVEIIRRRAFASLLYLAPFALVQFGLSASWLAWPEPVRFYVLATSVVCSVAFLILASAAGKSVFDRQLNALRKKYDGELKFESVFGDFSGGVVAALDREKKMLALLYRKSFTVFPVTDIIGSRLEWDDDPKNGALRYKNIRITLELKNFDRPMERISFDSKDEAEQWALRLGQLISN